MSTYGRYRYICPDMPSYHGFDRPEGARCVTVDELIKLGFVFKSVPQPYSLNAVALTSVDSPKENPNG